MFRLINPKIEPTHLLFQNRKISSIGLEDPNLQKTWLENTFTPIASCLGEVRSINRHLAYITIVLPENNGIHFMDYSKNV